VNVGAVLSNWHCLYQYRKDLDMQLLEKLVAGEPDAWKEVFSRTYPVAFDAARVRLGDTLRTECEDVAIEALAEIVGKVESLESENELKPLVAAIAHNIATDKLRKLYAAKRGRNKVESLEALVDADNLQVVEVTDASGLDELTIKELGELLTELGSKVKKEYRIVLRDHFFDQLSYNQIAEKHGISVGSVGVYIQRGLSALKTVISRSPKLKDEFLQMLGDAGLVRLLLPIITSLQIGGWFFSHLRQGSLGPEVDSRLLSEEDRLRAAKESLPDAANIGNNGQNAVLEQVRNRYPEHYEKRMRCEREKLERREAMRRTMDERKQQVANRKKFLLLTLALALAGIIAFALLR